MLRGNLKALNAFVRKEKKSQISNISSCLKNLEKYQNEPEASWTKKTIKTNANINETETEKQLRKSMFYGKLNKTSKPLATLTMKKKTEIVNIKNETITITTNPAHVKKIIYILIWQLKWNGPILQKNRKCHNSSNVKLIIWLVL